MKTKVRVDKQMQKSFESMGAKTAPTPKGCPKCQGFGLVYDSRPREGFIWRRHMCRKRHVWTTVEVLVDGTATGTSAHAQALKAMKAEAIGQLIEVLREQIA